MMYLGYIFNIFNRSVVSLAWEIMQMNFYVIRNYVQDFNIGYGILILYVVFYINELLTFWCVGFIDISILVPCVINVFMQYVTVYEYCPMV
jgi:hypothetical protein